LSLDDEITPDDFDYPTPSNAVPQRAYLGIGFHLNVPEDAYHADPTGDLGPSLSSSIAHLMVTRSPLHAWYAHPRLGSGRPMEPTEAMERGTLAHALLLGGGPEIVRVEHDNWRTKDSQKARDEARAAGKLPVLARKLDEARELADAMRECLPGLEGQREVTAVWREENGVLCRARFDLWDERAAIIRDFKFVENAAPDAIQRNVLNYGKDIQAAAYPRAAEALLPALAGRVRYQWIFAECVPPYCCTVAEPDGMLRAIGLSKWTRAAETWARCMAEKRWPGYGTEPVRLSPTPWALNAELEISNEIEIRA